MKMFRSINSQSGQTLTEFILAFPIFAASLGGGLWIYQSIYHRGSCAYRAFEAAHLSLIGLPSRPPNVLIEHTTTQIIATAHCGKLSERITLDRLEKTMEKQGSSLFP